MTADTSECAGTIFPGYIKQIHDTLLMPTVSQPPRRVVLIGWPEKARRSLIPSLTAFPFFFFSRGCEDTSSISYQFIKGPSDVLTREHFRRKLLALNCTCVLSHVHTWGSVFVLYKRVRCRRVSCAKWKQTKKACSEPVNEEELFRDIPHFGKAPESHCGPVTRFSMHSANPPGRV